MAMFVVEFSYGLPVPFMWLSVSKHERNCREVWGQAKGLAGKPERNSKMPEAKSELGSERYKEQRSERSERYKKAS